MKVTAAARSSEERQCAHVQHGPATLSGAEGCVCPGAKRTRLPQRILLVGAEGEFVDNGVSSEESSHMPQLTRITRAPRVMGGKPCIRSMRVTVGTVVGLVAAGRTREEILRELSVS